MRPIVWTVGPLAAPSATNIALSQSPGAAGNLTLNGALVASGVATLDTTRRVRITSGGDDRLVNFTIYGTDWFGAAISEVLAGSNGSTADSKLDYGTVTRIAISAAAASTVTVGTNGVASSPPIRLNRHGLAPTALQVDVTGTVNATVQQTLNDPGVSGTSTDWLNHPDSTLVALTGSVQGNYAYLPDSTRIVVNSQTNPGKVTFTVIQSGLANS